MSAERIVHLCRVYSNGNFHVLIPRRAKSAATMIALGSTDIHMGETSELGPIDTQIIRPDERGQLVQMSAYRVVKSYDDLMQRAETTEGHVEPFLQQLQHFEASEIEELRNSLDLAKDIAIRWLRSGMLAGKSRRQIEGKIRVFLDPEKTKSHGRGIFFEEAKQAGLNVRLVEANDPLWDLVCELYERTDQLVATDALKVIESGKHHFVVPARPFLDMLAGASSPERTSTSLAPSTH